MDRFRRHRAHSPSEPAIDRVLALTLALAVPATMLYWLLDAVGPALWPSRGSDVLQGASLDLVWVAAPSRRPERAPPEPALEPTLEPVPEVQEQEADPSASKEGSSTSPQAPSSIVPDTVSGPADPSGTVYDPSRLSQVATPATRLLRADTVTRDEPARVDESSLRLHPEPSVALAAGERCSAIVDVSLDAQGKATEVRLVGPCGNRASDAAALAAARLWSSHPEIRQGATVPTVLQVTVDVSLRDLP